MLRITQQDSAKGAKRYYSGADYLSQGQEIVGAWGGKGAERLGLSGAVRFREPMPARAGFALGRLMVAPSRAESLPYIILETAAAAVPLISTNVGGIPEVFGLQSSRLIPPGDATALALAISSALADPAAMRNEALTLRARVQAEFSAQVMADGVLAAYREALAGHRP